MRLVSWNVNGVRAAERKGFLEWLVNSGADVVCLQETKARLDDVTVSLSEPDGYASVWHSAVRKGYSGVATFFKRAHEPLSVSSIGIEEFDSEGRVQVLEYKAFTLVNAYFPNSRPERARLDYKLAFCSAMRALCDSLRSKGRNVILCGDYNIAHREIDLARPKQNEDNPGYYPEERGAMDTLVGAGYVDTFRHFTTGPGHYTWWSYRAGARQKNIGWRLDYHLVNGEFIDRVKESMIHPEVMGSDHCPVSITTR